MPRSRSTSPVVSPPSDPPAIATRPDVTIRGDRSRLAESGHSLHRALEQNPPLVDRRVAQSVGRSLLGVLRPDAVELGGDALTLVGIVFEDLPSDRAFDAEPVVRVVGIDDHERELWVLANPVDLLAMRGHVHQDRGAVVV